jgi:hypothetical protein
MRAAGRFIDWYRDRCASVSVIQRAMSSGSPRRRAARASGRACDRTRRSGADLVLAGFQRVREGAFRGEFINGSGKAAWPDEPVPCVGCVS